jgi:hypothetical protein
LDLRLLAAEGLVQTLPGCLSFDASRSSDSELGLQIADVVAGEVRRFFRFNSELLSFGSSLQLVTPESRDELDSFVVFQNVAMKDGRMTRTPEALIHKYMTPTENTFFPVLMETTASGCLCCVTEFGQERRVHLFQGWLFDLCD